MFRKLLLGLIRAYRYLISPMTAPRCRFYPSCSSYAEQALEQYGVMHGSALTAKRLAKCHPFHPGGYDPLPETNESKTSSCNC